MNPCTTISPVPQTATVQQTATVSGDMSGEKTTRVQHREGVEARVVGVSESGEEEMEDHNRTIMKIWAEKGEKEAVKQMFVSPLDGSPMCYADMRSFYG